MYENLSNAAKVALREQFIALDVYVRKEKISNLSQRANLRIRK